MKPAWIDESYKRDWAPAPQLAKRAARRLKYEANCEKEKEYSRNRKEELFSLGLCVVCGKTSPATVTLCNGCADKKLTPERLMKDRRRKALKSIDKRQQEREAWYD